MKKNNKVGKKSKERYKEFDLDKLKKVEVIISIVVGIAFLVLLCLAIVNKIFLPAALITFSLFLFCICYYYIDDENKKKLVYALFSLGVILIIIEVIYTLVRIY